MAFKTLHDGMLDLELDEMTAEFIQETLIKDFLEDNIEVLIDDHLDGGINCENEFELLGRIGWMDKTNWYLLSH